MDVELERIVDIALEITATRHKLAHNPSLSEEVREEYKRHLAVLEVMLSHHVVKKRAA